MRDSIKDLFFKSGFVLGGGILFGNMSCMAVMIQLLVCLSRRSVRSRCVLQSMAKQEVISESKSIKDVLYDRLDSVHVEVDRKESVEKEPFSISLNYFGYCLFYWLWVFVFVYWKS